jgi:hypothetical protein
MVNSRTNLLRGQERMCRLIYFPNANPYILHSYS